VSIKSGSRAEGLSIKGASKLLAYGALSGTKLRSGLRLCRDMEDMGVYFTSSANREVVRMLNLLFPYVNEENLIQI
jgi:hypothetical protein